MSSQVITADNAKIVIQINPQVAEGQNKSETYDNTPLKRFLKVQPKSLGIVQIMIGVVTFLLAIVLTTTIYYSRMIVTIGITYWGSLIYITAGSLSVAAEKKPNPRLVKASIGMNAVSAATAGIAIILTSIQLPFGHFYYYRGIKVLITGIMAIILVFSILQVIISICICRACSCDANPLVISNTIDLMVLKKEASPLNMPGPPRRN